MNTFKKILSVLLVMAMIFSFAACSDKNAEEIEELEDEIADLEEEIAELEEELEEAEEDEDEDAIEEIEKELEEKKDELKDLEDELEELEGDSKKEDKKSNKLSGDDKDAAEVVENYFKAMYDADAEGMLKYSLDPYAIAYYMDEEDLDDEDEVFEFFEDSEGFANVVEQDMEIEVTDVSELDEDVFEEVIETLADEYDYDEDAIEDARKVTIEASGKVEGEKISVETTELVVKIDGDWYLTDRIFAFY